jgi:hydrophobic/amphiphilic exporter-1 (mainly G- bacteria), HAE1 family
MTITELSIKRPTLIIVIFTVLVLGGLFSYTKLNYELMPPFSIPTLVISTPYPGASPTDVNQTVTKQIEDAVTGLSQLNSISSQSYEGVSVVIVEFEVGADMDKKQQEAQRIFNNLMSYLPTGVKTPVVSKVSQSDSPILRLAAVSKMGDREFYDLIDQEVVPQLKQIDGISNVWLNGGIEREIKVNLDRNKLASYGIPLAQVTEVIGTANMDFPTGKIKSKEDQITVRLAGRFTSVEQLRQLVIASRPGGNVRLGDVAEVTDGIKDQIAITRFNGLEGIGLIISKQSDANTVEICQTIKEKIAKVEEQYKDQGVKFSVAEDTSELTLESVDAVTHDLMLAVMLVAFVILIFLHSIRDSLIVLVAIPTSLISTFIAMYFFGYSLNLMTLLAMSLVVGILVDDSIVVLENIHRHFSMGKDKRQAALDGRNEIGFSALAITMVDVVVFLPIALVDSVIGDILRQFSVTIVVSTLMSLFVSFTLTPFLYSRFGKKVNIMRDKWLYKPLVWFDKFIEKTISFYVNRLRWVLNHKRISAGVVLLLFIVTGFVMSLGILGQEMVANGDGGRFVMKLEFDKSVTLAQNNLRTREVENFIMGQPNIESVLVNVGGSSDNYLTEIAQINSENKSVLNVNLIDSEKRNQTTEQIMLDIRKKVESRFPGIKVRSNVIGMMGGDQEPIMLVVSSEDHAAMMKTAEKLELMLEKLPGAIDASISVQDGNPEINILIDREKMASLGLSMGEVGTTLQNAFAGNTDAKYRDGLNEYDINIQLDEFDRHNLADVSGFIFVNNKGQKVTLSQFATITQGNGPSMVERTDRRTSVTVKSSVLGITSGILAQAIDAEIAKANFPKSVDIRWSGEVEQQNESFLSLGLALLAAILLVYLVMVALYNSFLQPFIVFFSVPVALIGALLALNLTMGSMSIFTILGIIMLLGLVSKNGILIVDFTNQLRERGMNTYDALLEAGRERLRPILMTTISMVFGMLPIALATGAGAEWKNGLAVVLIGGLTSSLILTVFVVPIAYLSMEKLQQRLKRRKDRATTLELPLDMEA